MWRIRMSQVEPIPAGAIEAYTSGLADRRPGDAHRRPGSVPFVLIRYRPYMKLFDSSSSTLRALMSGAVALVMSSAAFAHAHLISSVPAANADAVAPSDLTMHFTEPLEPAFSRITLTDTSGRPATPDASTVEARVRYPTGMRMELLQPRGCTSGYPQVKLPVPLPARHRRE